MSQSDLKALFKKNKILVLYLAANISIGADPPWFADQTEALRDVGGERERGRATLSCALSILKHIFNLNK